MSSERSGRRPNIPGMLKVLAFVAPLGLTAVTGYDLAVVSLHEKNQDRIDFIGQCDQRPSDDQIDRAQAILDVNRVPHYDPRKGLYTHPEMTPAYRAGLIEANPNLTQPLDIIDRAYDTDSCVEGKIMEQFGNRTTRDLWGMAGGVAAFVISAMTHSISSERRTARRSIPIAIR